MHKRNLLLIVPFLPYPLTSGGHQAVYNEIDVLREKYNIFVTYKSKRDDSADVEKFNGLWDNVKALPYRAPRDNSFFHYWSRRLARLERKLWKNKPEFMYESELRSLCSEVGDGYANFVNEVISENQIDTAVVEFANSLAIVSALPDSVRKVFIHHEIRFARLAEFLQEKHLESPFFKSRFTSLKFEEIGYLNQYDSIVVFSDIDAQKLADAGVIKPVVSSFCLVTSSELELKEHQPKPVLTFVGPEHHSPNYWGLKSFLDCCWNKVSQDRDIELQIVGNWSQKTMSEWSAKYSNVKFVGFVENLQDALSGSVMIVPIDVGSGIRTKILEAAFMGIPVVTTSVGVEGIPFADGKECLISDNVGGMSEKILSLMDDDGLKKSLARNAYAKARSLYSRERLLNTRMQAID